MRGTVLVALGALCFLSTVSSKPVMALQVAPTANQAHLTENVARVCRQVCRGDFCRERGFYERPEGGIRGERRFDRDDYRGDRRDRDVFRERRFEREEYRERRRPGIEVETPLGDFRA